MKTINILTVLFFLSITFLNFSCSGSGEETEDNNDNNEVDEKDSEAASSEENTEEETTSSDYQEFIQGFWETEDGEGKVQYEDNNVYGPELLEMEMTFKIEGDVITYTTEAGSNKNKIIELTKDKFVEETEDGNQTTWIRPKEETDKEISLDGEWEIKGGGMGYMKFEGNKVDMSPMGLYSYTIEGDMIKYKNIKDGEDFSQKIIKMTETELILENAGVKETYIKK